MQSRFSDHTLSVVLALGLIGCATAPEADAPATANTDADGVPLVALAPHWDALVREAGAPPSVRGSQRGTPMTVLGTLAPQASGATIGAARQFIADHAAL